MTQQQSWSGEPRLAGSFDVEFCDGHPVGGPRAARIRLTGELDIATTPRLQAVLDELFDAGERDVRVDLSALGFLACAGLHVLDGAGRRFRCAGGRLTLVGPSDMARRLMAITELDQALEPREN